MKLFFLSLIIMPLFLQGKVLIRTEGQVKDHVITNREIQIHDLVSPIFGGKLENFEKDTSFEQVIKEWLLFLEASSFYNNKISSSEISEKEAIIKKNISLQKKLELLGLTPQELRGKIQRQLEANRLFTFKKKASVLPVPLSEIEGEYTQNRIRYGTLNFEEAKNQIRNNKIQENLQGRLNQWFLILEKKYKAQRFSNDKVVKP